MDYESASYEYALATCRGVPRLGHPYIDARVFSVFVRLFIRSQRGIWH